MTEILERSNNSQTEIVSKTTFKELKKCSVLAKITARLETCDHDGYCSDDECKYKRKTVRVKTRVPEEFEERAVGEIFFPENYYWMKHLPVPKINIDGSEYCGFKYANGLCRHSYRYTLLKVEIVKNKLYEPESKPESKPELKSESESESKPKPKKILSYNDFFNILECNCGDIYRKVVEDKLYSKFKDDISTGRLNSPEEILQISQDIHSAVLRGREKNL